jgi:hypothetical protein
MNSPCLSKAFEEDSIKHVLKEQNLRHAHLRLTLTCRFSKGGYSAFWQQKRLN